jgi:S1-C subfamily serine protease
MKRILASLLVAVLVASPAFAQWPNVAKALRESIVFIQIGDVGSCTGFVIDNNRDFVLTAAHCDTRGQEHYVDLAPAKIVAKDTKNDLMVLKVEGIDRPALKLAAKDPVVGDAVASYGFGFGFEQPLFRQAHVSAVNVNITGGCGEGNFIGLDANFIPGQSGGPVVNVKGEVVLIVQLGSNAGIGLGVGADTIRDKMGKYFQGQ